MMDGVYHGDWADPQWNGTTGWKAVQQDFGIDVSEPEQLLYANYVYEDYSGSADVIWRNPDGSFSCVFAGHCSCYGLEGQWEPESYSEEVVRAGLASSERYSIFQQFKDVFAKAIEAGTGQTAGLEP